MRAHDSAAALHELGALRVRGSDAVRFLQGQLSQNVERVSRERSLLAGLHNAQGRVIALLRLIYVGDGDLLALLPRELVSPVATRLARFILRSKVAVTDESNAWRIRGFIGDGTHDVSWPRGRNAQLAIGDARIVCVGERPVRWMQVLPEGQAAAAQMASVSAESWQRHEITAGEPQVFATTSEAFVSQMLNLDLIDAIAFDKGCYTGQEIIARAHYRGRMKRRMQRFSAAASHALAPGTRGQLADGRSFTVVQALHGGDTVDFLAVAALRDAQEPSSDAAPADTAVIHAVQQPLPYTLPA